MDLTTEQLAQYNGLGGQPAYVGIHGAIFDVTNNPLWIGGSHQNGLHVAGKDLTAEFDSIHSAGCLSRDPVVGMLLDYKPPTYILPPVSGGPTCIPCQWKCEQPLNGYENNDVCGERRLNPLCNSNNSGGGIGNMDLTLAQLAQYNGLSGQPAYVAVNGTIYDMSSSTTWRTGTHHSQHHPGVDLTSAFANEHGDNRLASFPIIGKLITGTACTNPVCDLIVKV